MSTRAPFGLDRRTLAALGIVAIPVVAASLFVSDPVVRYGAWLVAFSLWMGWFVLAGVEWIDARDAERPDRFDR
jgi:hypothetical protein